VAQAVRFQFDPREEPFKSIKQMSRALRYHADNEVRRAMMKASRDAARTLVPHVKKHTPVKTGLLQRNIKAAGTRTIPKVRAGTKTRGGPYAWMRHRGTRKFKGVPYMREGISEGFKEARRAYIIGQRKAAKIFNRRTLRATARKKAGMGRVRIPRRFER